MCGRSVSIGLVFVILFAGLALTTSAATAIDSRAQPPGSGGAAGAADAAAQPAKPVAVPQPPVQISADSAEYFNKDGVVVFAGNVVAVQEDTTLTAERMVVTFEQPAVAQSKPAAGIGTPATARRITMIVAEKKVSLRQVDPETKKERYATGDKGVYDVSQGFVTMTGNPRLWEGQNVLVGDEMIFHLAEKNVTVRGKVNLKVFPDDLKGEKIR